MNSIDTSKMLTYQDRKANKSTIWILFLFLGWSHGSLNETGTQILFYLTLGGFGVWTIIRLFTLNKAIETYNRKLAAELDLNYVV